MPNDPLHYLPVQRWSELEDALRLDGPRGITGLAMLATQRQWIEDGIKYDFRVYCPFGDVKNGMIAIQDRTDVYDIVIQCPSDDTGPLENALKKTSVINWNKHITFPFSSDNVVECLKRVIPPDHPTLHLDTTLHSDFSLFISNRVTPYDDICLPSDITFDLLSVKHIQLLNSTWPYRYPNSEEFFELLIKNNLGYGLFKDNELVAWVLIDEAGMFAHLYTVEGHRKKGYAEILFKLVTNIMLKNNRILCNCVCNKNLMAQNFHKKMGYKQYHNVAWIYSYKKK